MLSFLLTTITIHHPTPFIVIVHLSYPTTSYSKPRQLTSIRRYFDQHSPRQRSQTSLVPRQDSSFTSLPNILPSNVQYHNFDMNPQVLINQIQRSTSSSSEKMSSHKVLAGKKGGITRAINDAVKNGREVPQALQDELETKIKQELIADFMKSH